MTQPQRPPAAPRRRKRKLPKTSILFFLGVGIIVWQAVPWNPEGPSTALLITGLVLCGFPVAEVADIFRGAAITTMTRPMREDDPEHPLEEGPP